MLCVKTLAFGYTSLLFISNGILYNIIYIMHNVASSNVCRICMDVSVCPCVNIFNYPIINCNIPVRLGNYVSVATAEYVHSIATFEKCSYLRQTLN